MGVLCWTGEGQPDMVGVGCWTPVENTGCPVPGSGCDIPRDVVGGVWVGIGKHAGQIPGSKLGSLCGQVLLRQLWLLFTTS